MKTNIALLALTAMTFLGACQFSGQGPRALGKNNNTYQGPSDGGGGDTCNGKMIESYKVDITGLDEYKEYIQPILDKTSNKNDDKDNSKGSPFIFSPTMKSWYIIDCKLQDIPKERKGLYLETYQTAIHTGREIFIDSTSFTKMAKEEKAKLLLHEMVMAYYLMKYLSLEDLCKISGSCSSDINLVSKWKMFRPETYRPLNEEDHQKIRAVTAWLWSQGDALTLDNLKKILKNNDFDKRFDYAGDAESTEVQIDPQVLVRMLKKHQWSKTFPKFCQFDDVEGRSRSTCKTEVQADVRNFRPDSTYKALYLKVKITRDIDQKIIENEFIYPFVQDKVNLYINKFASIGKAAPFMLLANWPNFLGVSRTEGMKSQTFFMFMNVDDLENPEIFQIQYKTYVWYSFEENIVEKDGLKYKEIYGYTHPIDEDSENLFVENELPFSFRSKMPEKNFISLELVGSKTPPEAVGSNPQ